MSEAAANKRLLEHAYRRWHDSRGAALDEIMALFADSVHFGSLADGREPATFTALATSRSGVRGYFDALLAEWTMIRYTVDHMIAEDDRVAVVGSTAWTNKSTGKTVDTPKVDVWRFKDGRAIEFYEYYDTAKLFAAAAPGAGS